jgi:CRP-like cAMP-binding protein
VTTPGGDEATLAIVGVGEEFGELALLRPVHRHTATVVALDDVVTLVIDKAAFDRLRSDRPEVAVWLIDVLARRVEKLSEMVVEAMFLSADRRVARRLLDVAGLFPDGEAPDVPLTQVDVAALAGISRPTANQVLGRLAERGLIRLGRPRITLLDRPGLLRAAGW